MAHAWSYRKYCHTNISNTKILRTRLMRITVHLLAQGSIVYWSCHQLYYFFIQAIRKAPQHSAIGFKQTAHKFVVVVQLLLGEIPDRATFRDPILKKSLFPYLQLTQVVRNGDLVQFNEVLERYGAQFQAERTYSLIVRLRHNVIKTGIRMVSLSYSR